METKLQGRKTETIITACRPAVIIGDRINAARNARVAKALSHGNLDLICEEAIAQVADGAAIINVNVAMTGVDEKQILPSVVEALAGAIDVPLCIETQQPAALAAALDVCPGKPLVTGINGTSVSLNQLLPMAVQRGAAVIAAAIFDNTVFTTVEQRVEATREVLRRCITAGLGREDVILDPLTGSLIRDRAAAIITLEVVRQVAQIEAVNLTLKPQALVEGQTNGNATGNLFTALAISRGVTCAIMDPTAGWELMQMANLLLAKTEGALEEVNNE